MVKARSSITSTALPAPTPHFIIEGSAGPGLLGTSSDCSHVTLQTGWMEKDENGRPQLHQRSDSFFSAFSALSDTCPWTLLILTGMKADIHVLVYVFGNVKNQGLDKSHDLTQYGLVMRRISKSVFFCHLLWEGKVIRLNPSICSSEKSSQNSVKISLC